MKQKNTSNYWLLSVICSAATLIKLECIVKRSIYIAKLREWNYIFNSLKIIRYFILKNA